MSQVTSLLRRVLPEVTPVRLASIIGVKALPPADISDIIHSTEKGDWNKLCILDMFLGCIAKALTVQLKAKGTTISGTAGTAAGKGVTTVTLPMIFNSRWVCLKESLSYEAEEKISMKTVCGKRSCPQTLCCDLLIGSFCHAQLHPQRGEPLVDERLHSSSDRRNNHKAG